MKHDSPFTTTVHHGIRTTVVSTLFQGSQVHGVDEGEAEFLNFVSDKKEEIQKKRDQENEEFLEEVRVSLHQKSSQY